MYASPLLLLICDVIWGKIKTHTHTWGTCVHHACKRGGKEGGGGKRHVLQSGLFPMTGRGGGEGGRQVAAPVSSPLCFWGSPV